LYSEESGRCLEVITTNEGMQFYSGNYINDVPGKNTTYGLRSGLCLETQFHPDAINQERFLKPLLKKDEVYQQQTIFRFSIK
jgi:aldose 1-epimerase